MGQVNEQLKQAREDAGLSKAAIAALIQVPEATYIEWECRGRIPRIDSRVSLAKALKMTLPELNKIVYGNEGSSSGTITKVDVPNKIRGYIRRNFRLRLAGIVDAGSYAYQLEAFRQILEEFDAMNEGLAYLETRRQVLIDLAALPFVAPLGLANRTALLPSSHYELFLKECGASLAACEELSYSSESDDLFFAFECVSRFLIELRAIADFSSKYRKQALELATHCAIQKALLGWDCVNVAGALAFALEAVDLATESGDICLQLSARSKLSWAYLYDHKRQRALRVAVEARDILRSHQGKRLPACIIGGTYSTLAVMQARNKQPYDTSLKMSMDLDPGTQVLYGMEFTREIRPVEVGKAHFYAGKTDEAMKAYAEIMNLETLIPIRPLPEDWRLLALLDMSRTVLYGPAKDMQDAIRYWTEAFEGAKKLKSEGLMNGALETHDQMKLAFPGEKEIEDLLDHTDH